MENQKMPEYETIRAALAADYAYNFFDVTVLVRLSYKAFLLSFRAVCGTASAVVSTFAHL